MQTEAQFLASQIYILQQRLNTIPKDERPASAKLQKAFEIEQRTVHYLKQELVEMIGKDYAFEMINEAQSKANAWYLGTHGGVLKA